MSWAPEVVADSSGRFYGNNLRFATYDEAYNNACDLAGRWMLVTKYRAALSDDPVNYTYHDNTLLPLHPRELESEDRPDTGHDVQPQHVSTDV